jgi:chromate reductase, NAD(P)H dehydrogenase (quinone)
MHTKHHVAVLVGSLRKDGYSQRLATALTRAAPKRLVLQHVSIADLPLYNEDLSAAPPLAWESFRRTMRAANAVLFVTPEYNRSIPGGLKNALDVGSRPYGQSVFDAKPAAVVSHSPGAMGGFGANHVLRQSLVTLNMPTLQQPEAYISNVAALFDEGGALIDDSTHKFLDKFMTEFANLLDTHAVASDAQIAS